MAKRPTPPPAFEPPACSDPEHMALKALQAGNATPDQQRRALTWIINDAAKTYDQPFRPGAADETSFACGRMFVGQAVVHELNSVRVKPAGTK